MCAFEENLSHPKQKQVFGFDLVQCCRNTDNDGAWRNLEEFLGNGTILFMLQNTNSS